MFPKCFSCCTCHQGLVRSPPLNWAHLFLSFCLDVINPFWSSVGPQVVIETCVGGETQNRGPEMYWSSLMVGSTLHVHIWASKLSVWCRFHHTHTAYTCIRISYTYCTRQYIYTFIYIRSSMTRAGLKFSTIVQSIQSVIRVLKCTFECVFIVIDLSSTGQH